MQREKIKNFQKNSKLLKSLGFICIYDNAIRVKSVILKNPVLLTAVFSWSYFGYVVNHPLFSILKKRKKKTKNWDSIVFTTGTEDPALNVLAFHNYQAFFFSLTFMIKCIFAWYDLHRWFFSSCFHLLCIIYEQQRFLSVSFTTGSVSTNRLGKWQSFLRCFSLALLFWK